MKKIHLSKMTKVFLLLSSLGIAATTTTVVTILFVKNNKVVETRYLFANQKFENKDQVFDYVYSQAKNTNYNFKNTKFLIDDKVFNSKNELDEFIQKSYPIESLQTIKDPNDYLVNNAGELSPLVLTGTDEKGIDVYKSINGEAVTEREGALNSYLNSFEEKYSVNGIYFDSFFNAQKYYKEIISERLQDPDYQPVKKYIHGGNEYKEGTEGEIRSWLKSNLKRGFEYNGETFSDFNYSEFKEVMKNLDSDIVDENILPVMDADKSSYWIDQSTTNRDGYFIGPKYIESNEQVGSVTNFEVVETQDVNALLGFLGAGVPSFIVPESIENQTNGVVNSTFEIDDYLTKVFSSDSGFGLDSTVFDYFKKNYFYKFGSAILEDASSSLNKIKSKEFTNFHKMLIVFKRLLDAAKIYNVAGVGGSNYKEFEQSVKKVVIQVLSIQKGLMEKLLQSERWSDIFLNDEISFNDIYSLFLNLEKFYTNPNGLMQETIKTMTLTSQEIIGKILKLGGHIKTIVSGIQDMKELSEKSNENYKAESKKVFSAVDSSLQETDPEELASEFGLKLKDEQTQILPLLAAIAIAGAIWAIGEMASFTTFITAEAKIDSHISIFYFEPTFKIPFTNTLPLLTDVNTEIIKLTTAPIKKMIPHPEDNEGEEIPVYEFNNQYFLDHEVAKEKLIEAIYINPERYLSCKTLVTSEYGDSYFIDLPPICKDDCLLKHEHMTASKHEHMIAEAKDKFVEKLFDKYYESDSKLYYNDGFHEFFETKKAAMDSLDRKVGDVKNYQKAYAYRIDKQVFYKDTQEEIIQFIKDNQFIENKRVINSELIKGMYFDKMNNYYDLEYKIYKILFYGTNKYFRTKLEAEKYLKNHLNIENLDYYETINTYRYDDSNFMSKKEFDDWIESRIVETK